MRKATSVYDFNVKNIDNEDVKLDKYKGKVMLIVNVASKCGFTPQFEGLEKLYKEIKAEYPGMLTCSLLPSAIRRSYRLQSLTAK